MTTEGVDVLLVTTKLDAASDAVAAGLKRAGTRFYRLNTEELPLGGRASCEFRDGDRRLWWQTADRTVAFDGVKRVWFRRHRLPALPTGARRGDAEYCLRESQWFVRGMLLNLAEYVPAAYWMSFPANTQRAESKMLQLHVAAGVGLTCPETLISNNPEEIRRFFARQEGRVVAKPLRLGFFDYGDIQTAAYTTAVSMADLGSDDALAVAPVIYQHFIPESVVVVSVISFYVALQFLRAMQAAVTGLTRRAYAVPRMSEIVPNGREGVGGYLRRTCNEFTCRIEQHRETTNEKVSQLAVAHEAMHNAVTALVVQLVVLVGIVVWESVT